MTDVTIPVRGVLVESLEGYEPENLIDCFKYLYQGRREVFRTSKRRGTEGIF